MNQEQILENLLKYLQHNIPTDRLPTELPLDFPLLDSGIIDSLGLFKLITHLENTFDVHIQSDDIVAENFATLQAIVSLIQAHNA